MEGKRARATLVPGQRGTKRLVRKYGDRLLCIRYRYDDKTRTRLTTVELVEEVGDWNVRVNHHKVWIRVEWGEWKVAEQVKAAGGIWHPERKLWRVPRAEKKTRPLRPRCLRGLPSQERKVTYLHLDIYFYD